MPLKPSKAARRNNKVQGPKQRAPGVQILPLLSRLCLFFLPLVTRDSSSHSSLWRIFPCLKGRQIPQPPQVSHFRFSSPPPLLSFSHPTSPPVKIPSLLQNQFKCHSFHEFFLDPFFPPTHPQIWILFPFMNAQGTFLTCLMMLMTLSLVLQLFIVYLISLASPWGKKHF